MITATQFNCGCNLFDSIAQDYGNVLTFGVLEKIDKRMSKLLKPEIVTAIFDYETLKSGKEHGALTEEGFKDLADYVTMRRNK